MASRAWRSASPRANRPKAPSRSAASAAGEIVTIEIADDGRGVDVRAGARAARAASGSPCPGAPDDAALLELISSPGFSTRDDSDRVSGRGFGMAVVQEHGAGAGRHDSDVVGARPGHHGSPSICR